MVTQGSVPDVHQSNFSIATGYKAGVQFAEGEITTEGGSVQEGKAAQLFQAALLWRQQAAEHQRNGEYWKLLGLRLVNQQVEAQIKGFLLL